MPAMPVGTRISVDEDRQIYISIGNTTVEIAERLGWEQENVWMPAHVEEYVAVRHPEIRRRVEAAAYVLNHPGVITDVPGDPGKLRFLIDAHYLRIEGFVVSRTMKCVDLLVELPVAGTAGVLRAYHLAPIRKGAEGTIYWP